VASEEVWLAEEEAQAIPYLEAIERRVSELGITTHSIRPRGPVADTVISRAAELEADLIAMTTHGRGGLTRVALGSVADEVVRRAPCPVLLVRAH
jgi:nucleotide-binding universal stress UspA family protein